MYVPIFQRDEAVKLVRDAIAAGIFNDLGSGSNVDICVITKDKVDYLRPYDEANQKGQRYGLGSNSFKVSLVEAYKFGCFGGLYAQY